MYLLLLIALVGADIPDNCKQRETAIFCTDTPVETFDTNATDLIMFLTDCKDMVWAQHYLNDMMLGYTTCLMLDPNLFLQKTINLSMPKCSTATCMWTPSMLSLSASRPSAPPLRLLYSGHSSSRLPI